MSTRLLRDTVRELGRYFGVRSADSYLNQILGGVEIPPWDAGVGVGGARGSIVYDFSGQTDEAKTVTQQCANIVTTFADAKDTLDQLATDICITPAQAVLEPDKLPLNRSSVTLPGGVKDEEQGLFAPEQEKDYYTTSDYIGTNDKERKANKVNVVQVFPAVGNVSNNDTDLVALFLSSVPTLELSRAIPMVDITVLTNEEHESGKTRFLSLGRHLLGETTDPQLNAVLLSDDATASTVIKKQGSVPFTAAGSMELFTSPQTMLPVNSTGTPEPRTQSPGQDGPIDVFRPMMSLGNLSISVMGTKGMHSYKSADLSLTLHDRGQLNTVLPFVSPGDLNRALIEITYGWTHPDGEMSYTTGQAPKSRQSDATNSNRYADLINSMRMKEMMQIVNSDFSFQEDGSVQINLKLASRGEVSIIKKDLTISKLANAYEQLSETTSKIKSILQKFRGKKGKFGKISPPQTLYRSTNANSAAYMKKENIAELKAFISKAKDKDLKEIGKYVTKLYGSRKNKRATGEVGTFNQSKAAAIKEIIDHLRKTPDPFLAPVGNLADNVVIEGQRSRNYKFKGMHKHKQKKKKLKLKYVSLGKVLSYFIGTCLEDEGFLETQLVFYPFNESSGYLFDSNISQFPIAFSDLEDILNERFSNTGRMSLQALLQVLNSYFLKDQGQPGYGFVGVFGGRNEDNKRRRKFNSSLYGKGKDKEKPDYQAIMDKKKKQVAAAYGLDEDDPGVSFRVPQVSMRMESLKASIKGQEEDKNKTPNILRIHVYDRQCNTNGTLRNVMDGFAGDGGTFNADKRKTRQKRGAQHDKVVAHHIQTLSGPPYELIKPAQDMPDMAAKASVLGIKEDDLKKLLKDMYFLPEASGGKIKSIYSSLFPTLIYGSLNSGILEANVQSMNNPQLSTVHMVASARQRDKNKQAPGFDDGLPMTIQPTELNLTVVGCPFLTIGQQFFIDMGTNTSADNFYGVFEVNHNFEGGQFKSSIRLGVMDSFGQWRSTVDQTKQLATLAALVAQSKK